MFRHLYIAHGDAEINLKKHDWLLSVRQLRRCALFDDIFTLILLGLQDESRDIHHSELLIWRKLKAELLLMLKKVDSVVASGFLVNFLTFT